MHENRNKILLALIKYFEDKGRVLTIQEYSRETDTPVRVQLIKQAFGSWTKMEKLMMTKDNKASATNGINVDQVIAARNKAEYDAAAQWKEASENQDKKARKEAEAQVVAETLARNAATPEGANANKIAIGGKLPSEQQDYSAMGATVEVKPGSLEQVVVDPQPEIVELARAEDGGKTPAELRDLVAADAAVANGSVPVDKSTAGGSTGEASIATIAALGGEAEKKPAVEATVTPKK